VIILEKGTGKRFCGSYFCSCDYAFSNGNFEFKEIMKNLAGIRNLYTLGINQKGNSEKTINRIIGKWKI
jgi:hypothetical protein